jgi:hypothetical protein
MTLKKWRGYFYQFEFVLGKVRCLEKMCRRRSEDLRWRLGFQNAIGVSSQGLSGGLALSGRMISMLVSKSYSKFHVDVWVTEGDGRMWRFTGFYGESAKSRRGES